MSPAECLCQIYRISAVFTTIRQRWDNPNTPCLREHVLPPQTIHRQSNASLKRISMCTRNSWNKCWSEASFFYFILEHDEHFLYSIFTSHCFPSLQRKHNMRTTGIMIFSVTQMIQMTQISNRHLDLKMIGAIKRIN